MPKQINIRFAHQHRTLSTHRSFYALPIEERCKQIQLLVCDMAGTTVDEGGIVYLTLQKCMNDAGLQVSDEEMLLWHGAQKREVVEHFVLNRLGSSEQQQQNQLVKKVDAHFEETIEEAYFSETSSTVKLIHPQLLDSFENLRLAGCKIALNTGYPDKIMRGLMKRLGLVLPSGTSDVHNSGLIAGTVDAAVSAQHVPRGRPAPYMVQKCMWETGVYDASRVAKAGDTMRDIAEGLNAGCGVTIGVLSGAGTKMNLEKAGADLILQNIVEFEKMRCQ